MFLDRIYQNITGIEKIIEQTRDKAWIPERLNYLRALRLMDLTLQVARRELEDVYVNYILKPRIKGAEGAAGAATAYDLVLAAVLTSLQTNLRPSLVC